METTAMHDSLNSANSDAYFIQKQIELMMDANNRKIAKEFLTLQEMIKSLNNDVLEIKRNQRLAAVPQQPMYNTSDIVRSVAPEPAMQAQQQVMQNQQVNQQFMQQQQVQQQMTPQMQAVMAGMQPSQMQQQPQMQPQQFQQQAPVKPQSSTQAAPRCGNFKSEDVAIDKFFNFSGKK